MDDNTATVVELGVDRIGWTYLTVRDGMPCPFVAWRAMRWFEVVLFGIVMFTHVRLLVLDSELCRRSTASRMRILRTSRLSG